VARARAPTIKIIPETEKNQRLAPMKSKCQRMRCPDAPSTLGERSSRERLMLRQQCLGEDDRGEQRDDRAHPEGEGEALDASGRQHEEDEGGEQGDNVGVDDRRDATAVTGGDRGRHRSARAHLLLDPLEDDDVGVGRDPYRQDQPRDPGQGQGDRDQFDQGEEDHPVGGQGDHAISPRTR